MTILVRYQFFVQAIIKQGNYKTDLAGVSGSFRQAEFVQILNFFSSVTDGVFGWFTRNHCCGKSGSL